MGSVGEEVERERVRFARAEVGKKEGRLFMVQVVVGADAEDLGFGNSMLEKKKPQFSTHID